jgi:hypothetical protein
MKLPLGVSLLGFYALMSGIAQSFAGLLLLGVVIFGAVPTGDGVFLAGALALGVGLLYVASALALWTMQSWAWAFGIFMSAFGIFNGVVTLLLTDSVPYGIAVLAFPVLVFWYLNRSDIRDVFAGLDSEQGS